MTAPRDPRLQEIIDNLIARVQRVEAVLRMIAPFLPQTALDHQGRAGAQQEPPEP